MNASFVETDLDSRNYRYLGLVLTNEEYTNISNIEPFIVLIYLGQLTIPTTATPIEAL